MAENDLGGRTPGRVEHNPTVELGVEPLPANASKPAAALCEAISSPSEPAPRELYALVRIGQGRLEAPARQIAENSAVDGGVVVSRMLGGQGNFGFDAARKEYVDLVEAGIADPAKVVRNRERNFHSSVGTSKHQARRIENLAQRAQSIFFLLRTTFFLLFLCQQLEEHFSLRCGVWLLKAFFIEGQIFPMDKLFHDSLPEAWDIYIVP